MFSHKMICVKKLFIHVQLWVMHNVKWIRCKIHLSTFYRMLGVDKYVDVWVNSLCQKMGYMITYKN